MRPFLETVLSDTYSGGVLPSAYFWQCILLFFGFSEQKRRDGRTSSYIACFLTVRVAKLALIMTARPTIGLPSYWQVRWNRAQKRVNLSARRL
jgi:hypothetical protein